MRYAKSPLGIFALLFAVAATLAACSGADTKAAADSSAAAAVAAAPAPAPETYMAVAADGSWSVDITPTAIVWKKGKAGKDSIVFDFKAPTLDGAIATYTSIKTVPDTHRIDITIVPVACKDKAQKEYTHKVQVGVDQKQYPPGCAMKM